MTKQFRDISVFIASPGDLAPERNVFKETIESLNSGFGDGAGARFIPLGWEDVLATTGRRTQSVINLEVDRCDLFVLVLHRRWGQDAPDSKYSSYTEEEYYRAYHRWEKTKKPEILVFFKNVDEASLADPGPQLQKVIDFRRSLEKSRKVLIRSFNTETDFGKELDVHLRAFAKNDWAQLEEKLERTAIDSEETKAFLETLPLTADRSLVEAEQEALTLVRAAIEAASAGRTQDASILFAKATEGTTNLAVLSVAAEFFNQIGDTENASSLIRRQTALAQDRSIAARHYMRLLPGGLTDTIQKQFLETMLAQEDPEVAAEIRSIHEEVFGGGRFEHFMQQLMVKHYSSAELVALARFLGTAEGQSASQKQPLVMQEAMNWGQREFMRVMQKRYGPLEDDSAAELPRLGGEDA